MTDKISPDVKSRRAGELARLGEALSEKVYTKYIKNRTELSVLVEERRGEYLFGHAQNMLDVMIKTKKELHGKTVKCIAVAYKNGYAEAELAEEDI